jgi:2-keto-3-deoxy-L-rhamnonate aldolase RhmA
VLTNRPELIAQAFDAGAQAVLVPQVNSAADAALAVAGAKYPPAGQRGLSSITRAGGYGATAGRDYTERANRETLVIVQIETPQAVASVSEIAAVPGVDAYFLGTGDLASAMGYPMQTSHPEVQRQADQAVAQLTEAGKYVGAIVGSYGPVEVLHRKKVRMLTTATNLILRAYGDFIKAMRAATAEDAS